MGRPAIITPKPTALPEHELHARLFRALGDATRLRLLEQLMEIDSAKQRELVRLVGATQSRVSEHLQILCWSGFVRASSEGRSVCYELVGDHAERVLTLMRDYRRSNEHAAGGCTVAPGSTGVVRLRPANASANGHTSVRSGSQPAG